MRSPCASDPLNANPHRLEDFEREERLIAEATMAEGGDLSNRRKRSRPSIKLKEEASESEAS